MRKFTNTGNFTISIMIDKNITSINSVSKELYNDIKKYDIKMSVNLALNQ